jgi:hypothetical protein
MSEVAHLNSDEILKLQVLLKESEESEVAVCDEIQQCRLEEYIFRRGRSRTQPQANAQILVLIALY